MTNLRISKCLFKASVLLYAYDLHGYAEESGEENAPAYVETYFQGTEEGEVFKAEEARAVADYGHDGKLGKAAPLHGAVRGLETFFGVAGTEELDQPRHDETDESKRGCPHAYGVGTDVGQQTEGKAQHHVGPARSGTGKDEQEVEVGQRRAVAEDVDVVEH